MIASVPRNQSCSPSPAPDHVAVTLLTMASLSRPPHATYPGHSHTLVHSDDLSSQRGLCPELVLAFPELGRGSRPREHDVFVLSVLGEDLSGVEVLDDLAADHRGEHEYANWCVCSVDDLMRTVLPPRKAGDVTLLQHTLTF